MARPETMNDRFMALVLQALSNIYLTSASQSPHAMKDYIDWNIRSLKFLDELNNEIER